MAELLRLFRNIFGLSGPQEPEYIPTRKRRFHQEEFDNFSVKLRRLNDHKMSSYNYDDWTDVPSTSKTRFSNIAPHRRNPIRPLILKTAEIIDLSDDDDVVEVTPRPKMGLSNGSRPRSASPQDVFLEARRSMKHCNKLLNGHSNDPNQTIRLDEQQLYRDMLISFPKTSSVYCNSSIGKTSTPNQGRKYDFMNTNSRTNKILQLLKDKKTCPAAELIDDKSNKSNDPIVIKDDSDVESVGSKKKMSPVNSFKKVLDNEPFMNPNYLTKFDEMRIQRRKDLEQEIREKRKQRDLFYNASRENIHTILESKIKNCKITDIILLDEPPAEKLVFPEFTPQQEAKINEALKCRNPNKVFIDKYNLKITAQDLKTFNEKQWLNDEVINFYVNLIQERSQKNNMPKVHAFSTFFYPKLISSGHSSLRRWTKRVDVFSHDIIVVPVHLGFHWCMAIIDFRDKSIRYYDSMLGKNMQCLNALENYLREEHKDKKKTEYDTSNWSKIIMKDIPRQMNGSDCGVFSCTFAEFITRNAKILFTQEHMPYIRRKMVIEIVEGRLLT